MEKKKVSQSNNLFIQVISISPPNVNNSQLYSNVIISLTFSLYYIEMQSLHKTLQYFTLETFCVFPQIWLQNEYNLSSHSKDFFKNMDEGRDSFKCGLPFF